ncbi:HIT family hydrolase [Prosthecomicrobium hirschii]|uniref:HIT family hydrolase n=1 Tax=Prosthecodimorpha hirschii TaxID=665126 RepID=A0A0P6VJ23_9HYPH|nr:HIT family protein [Prosthecomicrobium hirschii]KPL51074.1 HIT family hydrolase [Prosthecomicrobium hirschii]TPQ49430.1 HIT family protein [Prosthecomicrobium hirschii]
MSTAYDSNNIFAKILRGEIPCFRLYEDERTLAFMDIMPATDGHCLVIPKAPARNIFDCPAEDLAAVMAVVQKLALATRKAFAADGVTIQQFNEAAGGQEVFHLHFHVIPRKEGEKLRPLPRSVADMAELGRQADAIRAAL